MSDPTRPAAPWPYGTAHPQTSVPPQAPAHPRTAVPPRPTRRPFVHGEATRLLCAGVYFDRQFRRRVIQHLVEHEERPAAPSLGVDALPVLAHALRARRWEVGTGLVVLAVWVLFAGFSLAGVESGGEVPYGGSWFVMYALLCVVSSVVRGGRGAVFTLDRSVLKKATRGRLKAVLPVLLSVLMILYWVSALGQLCAGVDVWAAVVFPALFVLPVLAYRVYVISVMRRSLSRTAYPRTPRERLPNTAKYRRIGAAIDREQHARLVIYDPFRPFVGAGEPYKPWSIVTELKSRRPQAPPTPAAASQPGAAAASQGTGAASAPLTGREVIELIKPRLADLRRAADDGSRDRLRALEVEEMVYLPVGPAREQVSYDAGEIQRHLDRAVGEGAEARRHFLRIRVGAWDDQIEVSLLVRVHTQGGMLVLEVVPHVLTPPHPAFKSVDVLAAYDGDAFRRDAVRGMLSSPAAVAASVSSVFHSLVSAFRTWVRHPQFALPDAPVTSVRELGSVPEVSLLQEMDISRYVKTLQDRIASGVREALEAKGYETGEFERYVINVGGGGVFIGEMSGGAVATGERASAKHQDKSADRGSGKS